MKLLVTGADHGLGEAVVNLLAEKGHHVYAGVLHARPGCWGNLQRFSLDVGNSTSAAQMLLAVKKLTDHLDIVINNAAILGDTETGPLDDLDFDQMLRVFNVNTLGALRVSQASLPLLLAGHHRLIVNISSEAGSVGTCWRESWYAYAMSKAALNMQSALLHRFLQRQGGRVLTYHPGHVRTLMRGTEDLTAELSPAEAALRLWIQIERALLLTNEPAPFWGPNGETIPW